MQVIASGAQSVELVGASGKKFTLPASVPAGKYSMVATFEGQAGSYPVGTVTVPASGSLALQCSPKMKICRPR